MKKAITLSLALLMAGAGAGMETIVATPAKAAVVVVKHPRHRVVIRTRTRYRPGHFWHRGRWYVRVRIAPYRYPRGWRYRAWTVGAVLPPLFLAPAYYYDDYAALGLEAPPPGYRWVRYGPDALLVNIHTGEIEDVVRGVFY